MKKLKSSVKKMNLSGLGALFLSAAIAGTPAFADHHPGTNVTPGLTQQNQGAIIVANDDDAPAPVLESDALPVQDDPEGDGHIVELPEGAGLIHLPDLTAHPLAGSEIEIEIQVQDGLEQTGHSQIIRIVLPMPFLANPLNERLAEIRRELALHPENAPEIAQEMADALEEFSESLTNPETREALERLQEQIAQTPSEQPEALNDVVDEMWDAMQQLEQDTLSEAEQRLNELREQIKEAMENGASQEEMNELMRQANEAMQEMLQEQAEKAAENGDQTAQEQFEQMQEMLEQMQEMMEQMSPEQQQLSQEMMQQMMEQMQQMMQNQRMQQGGQQPQSQMSPQQMQQMMQQMQQQMQQMQEMQQMDEDLSELIEDQQELMDETIDQVDLTADELQDIIEQLWDVLENIEQRSAVLKETDVEFRSELEAGFEAEIQALRERLQNEEGATPEAIEQAVDEARALWPERIRSHTQRTSEIDRLVTDASRARLRMERQIADPNGMTTNQAYFNAANLQALAARLADLEETHPENQQQTPPDGQPQDGQPQDGDQQPQDDGQQQGGQQQQQSPQDLRRQLEQLREQLTQMREQNGQLQDRQEGLQRELERIIREAEQNGMYPGALRQALQDMRDADRRLTQGDPQGAVPEQAEVIQGLREGQEQLQQQMQQMQQQMQQGSGGQGMPSPSGGIEQGDQGPGFNRANPNDFLGVAPEDEQNRSRDIRDLIRERLNGEDLTPAERRYLMDLLENGADAPNPTRTAPLSTVVPRP